MCCQRKGQVVIGDAYRSRTKLPETGMAGGGNGACLFGTRPRVTQHGVKEILTEEFGHLHLVPSGTGVTAIIGGCVVRTAELRPQAASSRASGDQRSARKSRGKGAAAHCLGHQLNRRDGGCPQVFRRGVRQQSASEEQERENGPR